MDRRHLLKALFAGLTLAGISLPAFSAAKTTVTKAKQALKTAKTTKATGTTTGTKTAAKTTAKPASKATTKTAQSASAKGGKATARVQTVQSRGSTKGGKPTSVAKSSGRGTRYARPDYDDEVVSRIDTQVSPGLVRAVSLDIVNTGEKGRNVVYFENGQYQADALFELNLLLRDWRADKVRAIDPKLFDTLYMLQKMTGAYRPFEVVSGYRSPLTNFTLVLEGEERAWRSAACTWTDAPWTSSSPACTSPTSTRRRCSSATAVSATTPAAASSTSTSRGSPPPWPGPVNAPGSINSAACDPCGITGSCSGICGRWRAGLLTGGTPWFMA